MKEDIKYPYIGRNSSNVDFLICGGEVSFVVSKANHGKMFEMTSELESLTENITREYLANTYGKVESKEHAEFIVELCRANDIKVPDTFRDKHKHFSIDGDGLYFWKDTGAAEEFGEKQITIPLPPKQDDSDEWPKVGDEVLVCDEENLGRLSDLAGLTCYVIGTCNNDIGDKILTLECEDLGVYAITDGPWIKKPKTPEEELRDEIKELLNDALKNPLWVTTHIGEKRVDNMLGRFNVSKKPQ